MDKIINYEMVESSSAEDLERLVKLYIKDGWEPYGNPVIFSGNSFFQAVVFRGNDDK